MKKNRNSVQRFISSCRRAGVFTMLVFAATVLLVSTPGEAVNLNEKKVKIVTTQNTVLKDVLGDIHKQTGYQVVVSEELSTIPVVGVYDDISIEDFLRRVFKKYNVSVIYDEKKQVAYVRSFGEDLKQSQTGAYLSVPRDELLKGTEVDPNETDPLSGISLAELRRMQEEHLQEMERQANDPEAVDPLGGVPLADMKRNQQELDRQKADPATVDPLSGIPLADLRKNQAEADRRANDPDAVDPLSGLPMSVLRKNQEELDRQRIDAGGVDPLNQAILPGTE